MHWLVQHYVLLTQKQRHDEELEQASRNIPTHFCCKYDEIKWNLLSEYDRTKQVSNLSSECDRSNRSGSIFDESNQNVWLDSNSAVVAPLNFHKPYRKNVPTLKHLARLTLNFQIDNTDSNEIFYLLPNHLRQYLDDYPFWS